MCGSKNEIISWIFHCAAKHKNGTSSNFLKVGLVWSKFTFANLTLITLPWFCLDETPRMQPFLLAEILTSNYVGTQWFFLGCNQDNNRGFNIITKKKICLAHQKRKLTTIEINKYVIQVCLNSCIQSSLWLPNLKFTKNVIFPNPKKNEPMKISAPYFLYNQKFWNIQFPWKNIG